MTSKKVYISGPITGCDPEWVESQFARAEKNLIGLGHRPVNPLKIWGWWNWLFRRLPYQLQMLIDICKLHGCDAILKLPMWDYSRGAKLESAFAEFWKIENLNKDYSK